jgi:hypothetical protein
MCDVRGRPWHGIQENVYDLFTNKKNVRGKKNTCIESALMISPPYFTANSKASLDFPVPVAPHTTITGKREFKSLVVVLDNPKAAIFD